MNKDELENTILLNSIKEDLKPKDFYEKYANRCISIDNITSSEELSSLINKYKIEGYTHVIRKNSSPLAIKERTGEELIDYRIYRVEYTILRWFKDGLRKAKYMCNEKQNSLIKYKKRIDEFSKSNTIPQTMKDKIERKEKRLLHYQETITKLENIITNPQDYRYDYLEELAEQIFQKGCGWLK